MIEFRVANTPNNSIIYYFINGYDKYAYLEKHLSGEIVLFMSDRSDPDNYEIKEIEPANLLNALNIVYEFLR